MKTIEKLYRVIPCSIRWFIESLIQGKFYYKSIPIKRNKMGEITYEFAFIMHRPHQINFGFYWNVKKSSFDLCVMQFEFSFRPSDDLPF